MIRELVIEDYLVTECNLAGFYCWKFVRPGRRSAFDRIIPMPQGRVIWIETKRTYKDLTEAQQRERERLVHMGHTALCINSKEQVNNFVDVFLKGILQ